MIARLACSRVPLWSKSVAVASVCVKSGAIGRDGRARAGIVRSGYTLYFANIHEFPFFYFIMLQKEISGFVKHSGYISPTRGDTIIAAVVVLSIHR